MKFRFTTPRSPIVQPVQLPDKLLLVSFEMSDITIQMVILNIKILQSSLFVGQKNNSDGSEIRFLFLASCKKQICNHDKNARLQTIMITIKTIDIQTELLYISLRENNFF